MAKLSHIERTIETLMRLDPEQAETLIKAVGEGAYQQPNRLWEFITSCGRVVINTSEGVGNV